MNPLALLGEQLAANVIRTVCLGWMPKWAVRLEATLREQRSQGPDTCDYCRQPHTKTEMSFIGAKLACQRCVASYQKRLGDVAAKLALVLMLGCLLTGCTRAWWQSAGLTLCNTVTGHVDTPEAYTNVFHQGAPQ